MGLLDKLKFWKKKDGLDDLGDVPDLDMPDFAKDLDQGPGAPQTPPPQAGPAPPLSEPAPPPQPDFPPLPTAQPSLPPMHEPAMQHGASSRPQDMDRRDVQLISAKLDTLKSQLDNLSHRIAHIEKLAASAQGEQDEDTW